MAAVIIKALTQLQKPWGRISGFFFNFLTYNGKAGGSSLFYCWILWNKLWPCVWYTSHYSQDEVGIFILDPKSIRETCKLRSKFSETKDFLKIIRSVGLSLQDRMWVPGMVPNTNGGLEAWVGWMRNEQKTMTVLVTHSQILKVLHNIIQGILILSSE